MNVKLSAGYAEVLTSFRRADWRPHLPAERGVEMMDAATAQTIELPQLFATVDSTVTRAGRVALYRSLAYPLTDAAAVQAKQSALRVLENDPVWVERIESLIDDFAKHEESLYQLLLATFTGGGGFIVNAEVTVDGYGYESYRRGVRGVLRLTTGARQLPDSDCRYLNGLVDGLKNFAGSRAFQLMRGPALLTERGIKTRAEKPWYMPAIKFRPTLFKPGILLLMILLPTLLFVVLPSLFASVSGELVIFALFLFPLLLAGYIPIVGRFDRDSFIYPLREIHKNSSELQRLVECLGSLDELLAWRRYAKHFGSSTCLPTLVAGASHRMVALRLRNPVLGFGNADYVANDVRLDGQRLTFVTGPNSGGKTAFGKTLAQALLLAQAGGYVPAAEAELVAADHLYYLAPETNTLADHEGRFGTELQHIKEIFLAATPRSLVMLDEMAEGTTYEERLETSYTVLHGFYRLGNNTLLITHNHQLVDRFRAEHIGCYLQAWFEDDAPTYRLVEGISRVSHADRIARKIGFSKDDIDKYLEEKGAAS